MNGGSACSGGMTNCSKTPGHRGRDKNVQWRAFSPAIEHLRTETPSGTGPLLCPVPFVPIRSCFRRINEQLDRACLNTMSLFRRRNYAPLTLVAIRACSSPCAVLRRSARLSSRRENAETFASLLVPTELSRSSLIFTPRGYKRTRVPHRRYSDCYTKCQSRYSSAPGSPPKVFSVGLIRGPRVKIFDFRLG